MSKVLLSAKDTLKTEKNPEKPLRVHTELCICLLKSVMWSQDIGASSIEILASTV